MTFNFAFIMDISILVLLAATVFLAFRLTMSLRTFKESRFEMEGLVNRLSANVEQAERAIGGMQNTARKAGIELDEIISDAKKLADELKFMNETGDNLAGRLEKLAEKNRELIQKIETTNNAGSMPIQYNKELPRVLQRDFEDDEPMTGFAIQDREYDAEFDEDFDAPMSDDNGGLQSQAERELFEALQSSKSRQRGRA